VSLSHTVGGVIVTAVLSASALLGTATPTPTPTVPTPATTTTPSPTAGTAKKGASSAPAPKPKLGPGVKPSHPDTVLSPGTPATYDSYSDPIEQGPAQNFAWDSIDVKDATIQSGELRTLSPTSIYQIYNSVWLTWTAPRGGYLEADTFPGAGSDQATDTTLAVFTGSTLKKAKRLAYNDDSSANLYSQIVGLRVTAGVTYHFQIGLSYNTGTPDVTVNNQDGGYASLNVNVDYDAPSNDNLGAAKVVTGSHWVGTGTSLGSTTQAGENVTNPVTTAAPVLDSVWYKWTPSSSGTISIIDTPMNLNFAAIDANYLAIYELNNADTLSRVQFYQGTTISQPAVPVNANSTYYFAVGEVTQGDEGSQDLSIVATYLGPQLTSISKSSGSHNGGTSITLTGVRLSGVGNVCFGPLNCTTPFSVVSSTKIKVTVPAGTAGTTVPITVKVGSAYSEVTSHARYKFT
jgi:hypothetical protein